MSRAFGNLLGVIGAGMVGYQKGVADREERERRRERDDYERRQRERTEREQQRQDEIRAGMAEAYAPTTVQSGEVYQPAVDDDGNTMPANPTAGTYKAGGQRFANEDEAKTAAIAYNSPAARTMRMSDVLGSKGEAVAAQNLRTAARQERMGELQLNEAEAAHINKMFDQSLESAGSWDAVAELVSKSSIGGDLQLRAVPSADGKTVAFMKIMPDGSLVPASNPFPNSPQGLLEAKVGMSRLIPLSQKLDHLYRSRTAAADINLKNAHADYYKKAGDAAATRADRAGTKADNFDEKQWDAAYKVEPSFVTFADDMGGKGVESPELRLVYRSELTRMRNEGGSSPSEASEAARTVTLQLKNAASARVAAARDADPKSKLTELDAVKLILAEFEAARKKTAEQPLAGQAAPAAAAGKPSAASPAQKQATPIDEARARRVAAQENLNRFGSRQRAQNPMAFQAAQAELAQAIEAERALTERQDAAANAAYDQRAAQVLGTGGPVIRFPKP